MSTVLGKWGGLYQCYNNKGIILYCYKHKNKTSQKGQFISSLRYFLLFWLTFLTLHDGILCQRQTSLLVVKLNGELLPKLGWLYFDVLIVV